ncbi:MAG: hypothetical protein KGR26_00560, partial [Cyanobacteria bacterium REEB65]|nr:hypothetical protein [Cyanobacteria bacterium REEB65]
MSGLSAKAYPAVFLLGALAMGIASGCGTRVGPTGDGGSPSPAPTIAPTVSPIVVPTPMPQPLPTVQPVQPVQAVVSSQKKYGGLLFGLIDGKCDAQISVTNPNAFAVTATVNVSFTKKGQSVETQTQGVNLQASGNQTIEFKATQTSDAANVSVTGTQGVGMTASSNGSPYGAVPGYGSTYGSSGTTYGTTYGSSGTTYGSTYGSSGTTYGS